jgi:DNA processing protein
MEPLAVRAVLARTPALTAHHVHRLLLAANSEFERLIEPETLAKVELPPAARGYLHSPDRRALESDLGWIDSSGAHLLAGTDADYPGAALEVDSPPAVLFVRGDPRTLSSPQIAMVGSRTASMQGCKNAFSFAASFVHAGVTVTSGLAAGIDSYSHTGALSAGGPTIAVCGTGLDRVYPIQHGVLAEQIADRGALVSRLPPGTPPLRSHFPQRNQLISALARGVLVVEAALASGSLLTARYAFKQGRAVFALPGRPGDPLHAGCHELIRTGARLVEQPTEVLLELKFLHEKQLITRSGKRPAPSPTLDKGYEMLLDAVGFEPATVDALVFRTGLPSGTIASMLLDLELQGRIASYPGGRFGRVP